MTPSLPHNTGIASRVTVLVLALLIVAGGVAFSLWHPSSARLADLPVVGAAFGDHIGNPVVEVSGGDPKRGLTAIQNAGCMSCHTIPGVPGAKGTVGPPLTDFADRVYIAGMLPNTPKNLERWLANPQAIVPGNAMPALGLTPQEIADIAAYLYTLRGK